MASEVTPTAILGSRQDGLYVRIDRFLNIIESQSADIEAAALAVIGRARSLANPDAEFEGVDALVLVVAVAQEQGLDAAWEITTNITESHWVHTYLWWMKTFTIGDVTQFEAQRNKVACMNSMYSTLEAAFFEVADHTLCNELLAEDIARQCSTLKKWEVLSPRALSQTPHRQRDEDRRQRRTALPVQEE